MNRFIEKALQDQPKDAPLGKFIVQNWKNTHDAFVKLGTLKGAEGPEACFTEQFIPACNDFDHAAIVEQA